MLMAPTLTVRPSYVVSFQMRIFVERSNRPATSIVDKEGVVKFAPRAKRFNDRPSRKEIVKVLKSS